MATDFELRSFGQELALCQRYAFVIPYGGNSGTGEFIVGSPTYARLGNAVRTTVNFPVPMRANPTFTGSATNINYSSVNSSANFLANTVGVENANSHFNVTAIQYEQIIYLVWILIHQVHYLGKQLVDFSNLNRSFNYGNTL